jgi:predicted Zn-dependent peptidase
MSSRLFQEIREKRGLCYTIFAQAGAYADTGMLTIYAGTSGEQIAIWRDLTIDEMKRAAEDMSAAELDRARAQMKAGLLMGLESPSARAERWRGWWRSGTGCRRSRKPWRGSTR